MVVVGVLITDADDAGPLRVQLARSYWPRLNSALDLYVGVLPREIIDHILNLFVHQGPGASAPGPQLLGYHRIRVRLQPTHEVAVVLVDQCEAAVLEVRQIEQHERSMQPRICLEQRAVVRFLVGYVDPFDRLVSDVVEQVGLRSSLLLVTGFEFLGEKLVQPQHGPISAHHISEPVDISVNSVWNSDLVEHGYDEVAEILRECRR